ncbi:MAG: S1C family serine protease [Oscillospiraceae bacterium]
MRFKVWGGHEGMLNDDPWNTDLSSDKKQDSHVPGRGVPSSKKRQGVQLASVIIAIAVMVSVITTVFGMTGILTGNINNSASPDGDADNYDDFHDYFDNYYQSGTSSGINYLPMTEPDAGAEMTLISGDGGRLSLQDIYEKCSVSIVAITSSVDGNEYSWGTGIILTEDGYIITNSHVLDDSDFAVVTLSDDREYPAMLVGYDALSDIAVIKIDCTGLTPAEFGSSSELRVGDDVVAIGNPLGEELRGTMTNGIISAINRDINMDGNEMTLIQTNAAINGGNSGGALVDMSGRVIGITNMKIISYYTSIEGIGFAIPTGTVKPVVDEIMQNGYVSGRPGIGVTVGSIPESAQLKYDMPDGVYVSEVAFGSGAETAGILPGDVITAADGAKVTTIADLNSIKSTKGIGDTIWLTVWRDGDEFDIEVELRDSALFG